MYLALLGAMTFGCAVALLPPAHARAYDINKTSEGEFLHWPHRSLIVRLHPDMIDRFGDMEAHAAADAAAAAWAGVTGAPIIIVSDGVPDAWITLVSDWHGGDREIAQCNTTFFEHTGEIRTIEIAFQADKPIATDGGAEAYDLQSVLTHEFGHALGLNDSTHARSDIMWPNLDMGDVRHEPSAHDLRALAALYKRADSYEDTELARMGCQTITPHGSFRSVVGPFAFLGLLSAFFLWIRRRDR